MSIYIDNPRFLAAGESCVVVEFADEIDRAANDAVIRLKTWFERQDKVKVKECLPTYRSLAVYFDPLVTSGEQIKEEAAKSFGSAAASDAEVHKVISIPVCYSGEYGPDIENVAGHAGISSDEVVLRHSAKICHCYMIGFVPGFAYLGGMDESISTPRLQNPRTIIPAGSVGIAGKQTGIYPIDSPGGWQLIGRTPIKLFTPDKEHPTLIKAGYGVRFVPVSEEEYRSVADEVARGVYKPLLEEVE